MSLTEKLETAAANGLRPMPEDPAFEDRITELYRSMLTFSDLPMACSQGERMDNLKQRFLVYWTYEALEEGDISKAANWRFYMDQCLDSPAFLDSDNVALMVDQMAVGIAEGKLSYETIIGVNTQAVKAIASIPSDEDVAAAVLNPLTSPPPGSFPHLRMSRVYPEGDSIA